MADPQKTILVVEDDAMLRQVIADALEGEDYVVIQAGHAAQALELATKAHPDLILLDLALRGPSGIELLEEIKRCAPTREIPVLIMSGYALMLTGDAVRQADGTVAKPFDLDDLFVRVDRLASHRQTGRSGHVRIDELQAIHEGDGGHAATDAGGFGLPPAPGAEN